MRKRTRFFTAFAVIAIAAGFLFALARITESTPVKTVSCFYRGIEKRDLKSITAALSDDPLDAASLHVGLAPERRMEMEIRLRKDATPRILNSFKSFLSALPEVLSVSFVPKKPVFPGLNIESTVEGILKVILNSPADSIVLYSALSNRQELARSSRFGPGVVRFPLDAPAKAFLVNIPAGIRFRGIEYACHIENDLALVAVSKGILEKKDSSGKTTPMDMKEIGELGRRIPESFLLRRARGQWKIISFPALCKEKPTSAGLF